MPVAAQHVLSLERRDSAAEHTVEAVGVASQASAVRTLQPVQDKVEVRLGGSAYTCCCTGSAAGAGLAQHKDSSACWHMLRFAQLELVVRQELAAAAEPAA